MWRICNGILPSCKEEANLDKYCVISLICGILKTHTQRSRKYICHCQGRMWGEMSEGELLVLK